MLAGVASPELLMLRQEILKNLPKRKLSPQAELALQLHGVKAHLYALEDEKWELAEELIRSGRVDIDAIIDDETALHIAIRKSRAALIIALNDMGADPTILDKRGFTPIDVIPAQSKEIFSIIINSSHLLVYHALTNPKGGLLHLALRKNLATAIIVRDELLKYFNQESLRDFLNLTDAEGNNPLHIASLVGYPDLIFFCLQYGAKLYSCNKKGLIPDQSARGEHLGIFQNYFKQILIPVLEQYEQKYKERAIFYMAAQGQAALLYAMGKRTITSLVEPVSGYSTLQIAAGYGHAEAVQVLLMQGADPYGKGGRRNRSTWEIARTKNKDQKISEGRKQVLAVLKEWKQKARHKYESKPIEEQAASEKDLLELTALIQSANINEPEPHERKESDYPPPRVIIPASKIRPVASFLENLDETIHLQMAGNNKILRAKW